MVRGVSTMTIPTLSYSVASSGKMSIPVDSASLVYSHFEHVSGVLAPEGTEGISISKLNLLDALISQLSNISNNTIPQPAADPYKGVDAIIENLQIKANQAKSANEAMPYNPLPNLEPGMIFDLAA